MIATDVLGLFQNDAKMDSTSSELSAIYVCARAKKSALGHARREDRDLDIRKPLQTTRRELRMTEKQFQSKVIRVPQRGKPIYTVIP